MKTLLGVNPIVLIIAAIAALVAGFIYLWNTSEEFRNFWINLWENIKEIAKAVVDAIVTFFTETIPNALNSVKEFFKNTWDAIKTGVSTAWNAIKETIANIVNGIKDFLTGAWDAIKTGASNAWNAVKTTVTTVWDGIKSGVSSAVNGVKETISGAWNAVKSTTSSVWNGIKSAVSSAIDGVKSTISNGLNSAKSTITNILNAIKSTFSSVWDGAKNIVSNAINRIKSFLNFHWELPKLKLPHISISGRFSINPPSAPHFSIQWYKKAMDEGMILNAPTIFGAAGGKLLGGGEAGPEAVVGAGSLRSMIQEAVASQTATLATALGGDTYVYIGEQQLDAIIQKSNQRVTLRSGGRAK